MTIPATPLPIEGVTIGYGLDPGTGSAPTSFTTIAQVHALQPPGGEVEAVETSHLASVAKTYRAGYIPDAGEVEFDIWYNPNIATGSFLQGLTVSGAQGPPAVPAPYWWKVTFANDGAASSHANAVFQAVLTKFAPDSQEENNNVTAAITLQISGAVVWTAGS